MIDENDIKKLQMAMNGGGFKKKDNNQNKNSYKKNNKNVNSSKNNNWKQKENDKYVGAPYNFVPFADKTISIEEKHMAVHGVLSNELLSGEITYKMKAETPVFVDDGTGNFSKNSKGNYAIPGSSMRGLIRTNVQILGLSGFSNDIDDYNLMYRNVANGAEKENYNTVLGNKPVKVTTNSKPISILTHVKAGYLVKEKGHYLIYKTKVDKISDRLKEMNYYVLSEHRMSESIIRGAKDFSYFLDYPERAQHDLTEEFEEYENKGRVHYKGKKIMTINRGITQYHMK